MDRLATASRRQSRRAFLGAGISVAGLALVSGCDLLPQQARPTAKVPRIGVLANSPVTAGPLLEAFRQGLSEHGWVEGQPISIEYRYAEGSAERLREYGRELAQLPGGSDLRGDLRPDRGGQASDRDDPDRLRRQLGAAGNRARCQPRRPGGTVTGIAQVPDTVAKEVEILKEAVPAVTRMTVLWVPGGALTSARAHSDGRAAACWGSS